MILRSVYWDKNSSPVHPKSPLASLSLGPQRALLARCRLFIQRDFPTRTSFCQTIAPQAQLFPAIAIHHANSGLTLQSSCFCWCCCLNSYKLHSLLLSQSSLFWQRNIWAHVCNCLILVVKATHFKTLFHVCMGWRTLPSYLSILKFPI